MDSLMLKIRRARLERFFTSYNLEAILFSSLPNIRYLSGFSGSEGALVLTRDGCWLMCDSRYTAQAQAELVDGEVRQFSEKQDAVRELVEELKVARLGFEASH